MPGLTGNAWFDNTPLPRSPGGLIAADAHCRVAGMERVYVAGDAGSFPGPDWMPKQAHMADLQAATAAENLAAELAGRPADKKFKVELMCIVDSLDAGMLVRRTESSAWALPRMKADAHRQGCFRVAVSEAVSLNRHSCPWHFGHGASLLHRDSLHAPLTRERTVPTRGRLTAETPWYQRQRSATLWGISWRGNSSVAASPPPGRLHSSSSPPCRRAASRAMARPRPTPPVARLREVSSRT
jgi:hypothetical protein